MSGTLPRQRSRHNLKNPMPAPPTRPTNGGADITGYALRQHLQTLLEQKSSQLQMLGTMGQEILKQQQELEERIRGFEEGEGEDEDEIGEETRKKLEDLDSAMRLWEDQNEGMMRSMGVKVCTHWVRLGTHLTLRGAMLNPSLLYPLPPSRQRWVHPFRDGSATPNIALSTWSSPLRSVKTFSLRSGVFRHC